MAATTTALLLIPLSASLLLNLHLLSPLAVQYSASPTAPRWADHAAAEAESVAAIPCSGHGEAFLDGVLDGGGQPVCECHKCYIGTDCSGFDQSCVVDLNGGDPLYLEPYWRHHASISTVVISGWHRMSYSTDGANFQSQELERHIRLLHQYAGNAVTEGRYVVFGIGSTQLLNAAVHALSPDDAQVPATVVAAVPYYQMYAAQTSFFNERANKWGGAASNWVNLTATSSSTNLIEFVTSPNNPDGFLKTPVLNSSSVIYDHAYYWPHYTAIKKPVDGDVMLFTMSKVSGHAGSRFGWAVIKDEAVYNRVTQYVQMNILGSSHEMQLRMLKIAKGILAQERNGEGDIFKYGYGILSERWRALKEVVDSSNGRFSLPQLRVEYCGYFDKVRDPSPAYAYLKCEKEDEEDCYQVLYDAGILSRTGSLFGDSTRYTRLTLLRSDDDFEHFMSRFRALVLDGNDSHHSQSQRFNNLSSW